MARILAIDYGSKRVGLAVTDPLQIIVSGLGAIERKGLSSYLKEYMIGNEVEKIVMGYPSHPDGKKLDICYEIDDYIHDILQAEYPNLPIVLQDENNTSVRALEILVDSGVKKSQRKNKKLIDELSAILILQRYLGHI